MTIVGLLAMLIGAIDPLEGSLVILPGSGLIAFGAFLAKLRYRRLLYWAFGLIVIGVGAILFLSMFGGIGGNTGRSLWWGRSFCLSVGWIICFIRSSECSNQAVGKHFCLFACRSREFHPCIVK
jgi:hypothetical protein